ncbi:High mobility group box [Mycena kentingensis (nom. inval.)]|nr:High mobility group box [Mycena kentingensis (nom. inval.)]
MAQRWDNAPAHLTIKVQTRLLRSHFLLVPRHHPLNPPYSQMVGPTRTSRPPGPSPSTTQPQPPRPPNAFILYRSDMCKKYQGSVQRDISKFVSQQWHNETADVRAKYEALAEEKKREHARMYPNYKFKPVSAEEKRAMKEERERVLAEKEYARLERLRLEQERIIAKKYPFLVERAAAPSASSSGSMPPYDASMPPYDVSMLPYDASMPHYDASMPPYGPQQSQSQQRSARYQYGAPRDYPAAAGPSSIPTGTNPKVYIQYPPAHLHYDYSTPRQQLSPDLPVTDPAPAEADGDLDWSLLFAPLPAPAPTAPFDAREFFNFDAYYEGPSTAR